MVGPTYSLARKSFSIQVQVDCNQYFTMMPAVYQHSFDREEHPLVLATFCLHESDSRENFFAKASYSSLDCPSYQMALLLTLETACRAISWLSR